MSFSPSLLSPIGGELFDQSDVSITWQSPSLSAAERSTSNFNIYVNTKLDLSDPQRSNWILIGSVPASQSSFTWRPSYSFNSNSLRIGVSLVLANGQKSPISYSPLPFSRYGFKMDPPELLSPTDGQEINGSMNLILNISKQSGVAAFMRVFAFFSSESLGISRFPIIDNQRLSRQYKINLTRLGNCDDGVMSVYYKDSAGRVSTFISSSNLKIRNTGTFILDTEGPDLSLELAQGRLYVTSRDVEARLFSYDETTEVSACKFDVYSVVDGKEELDYEGEPRVPFLDNNITLSEGDGPKIVRATAIDIAGNAPRDSSSSVKTVHKVDSLDHISLSTNFFIYVAEKQTDNTYRLFKLDEAKTFVSNLPSKPLSITEGGGSLFVSLEQANGSMYIVSPNPSGLTEIVKGTNPSELPAAAHISFHPDAIIAFDASGQPYRALGGTAIAINNQTYGPISSSRRLSSNTVAVSVSNSNKVLLATPTSITEINL